MAELRGCDFPEDLLYHPETHLWFATEGGEGGEEDQRVLRVGVTPFGVAIAGEILLFTAKPVGLALGAGRAFGLLEAGKTVFPVKTPVAARLLDINPALVDSARAMNLDAYAAWLVRLAVAPLSTALNGLLPWPEAAPEIERQMDLWRFEHLSGFIPPLVGEGAKGI